MTTAAPLLGQSIGPTWARDESGRFTFPERTLGWAVIDWCHEYLLQPDGPDAGDPWRFTKEQSRFVLHWYSLDERGRFIYRAGMLRRMKGWGKDPFIAALCCAEFLGPCRFAGWGKDGQPIAEAHYSATVQVAAVSQDQVKRNMMSLFPALFSARAIREYELDIGKEIIWAHRGRCRIEMLTASARSAEGPRPTLVIKNETQHWVPGNGGIEMAEVCARNVAKSRDGSARTIAISNAHAPGELSDAELDYEASMKGDAGFLYDSLEASDAVEEALRIIKASDAGDDEARLRALLHEELEWCRGDSDWLDLDRILDEALAPKTSVNVGLRFYFNRLAASEERAFRREQWDALVEPGWHPEPGALVTLGFDGSVNDDWTALIGTDVRLGRQWVAGIWEPRQDASGNWHIDVAEVDATVAYCMETYDVWRMNADPYYWMEQLSAWAGLYNQPGHERIVIFATTNLKQTALAVLNYRNAIEAGELAHDGDERMAWAIGNCHKRMLSFRDDKGEPMWVLQKERPGSPLKIDPAMAGALSWQARLAAVQSGVALEDKGEIEVWWV